MFPTKYVLVASIGKHQSKYYLSIYQGNYSGKGMNEKNSNKYDDVFFSQTQLSKNLNLSANLSVKNKKAHVTRRLLVYSGH